MAIYNLGSMNIDYVYDVDHILAGGETLIAGGRRIAAGGKGLNQSIAAARSGAETHHAGCMGQGGEMLLEMLKDSGVRTELLVPCDLPQGHTFIQVDKNGQNSILVYSGSNYAIGREQIDALTDSAPAGSYLLLQNEISNLGYALEAAKRKKLRVVLNASPITEDLLHLDLQDLEWISINEIECAALGGCESVEESFETLKKRFSRTGILLTLGSDGCVCWKDGREYRQSACDVRPVDTTAAGDSFTGFFISCLVAGRDIASSLRLASAAAAIAVSRPGAAPSIPVMEEVLRLEPEMKLRKNP